MKKIGEKSKERKEIFKELQEHQQMENKLGEMQKSSNERELERYMKESREEKIKVQLENARKLRDKDATFNHNPLDVPNITGGTSWEVLKERNMFANQKNMFLGGTH